MESDSPGEDELLFFDHPCPRYDQHVTKNEVNKFSLGYLFVCLFVCFVFCCCLCLSFLFIVCLPCCILQSLSDMIDSFMNSSAVRAVVERVQAQIDPGTTVTAPAGYSGCLSRFINTFFHLSSLPPLPTLPSPPPTHTHTHT